MIIEVSELRRVLEHLENNNVKVARVSFRPSTLFPGFEQLNIESMDEHNGAGGNIESFIDFSVNDLPF